MRKIYSLLVLFLFLCGSSNYWSQCDITVTISGTSWLDETSFTLFNNASVVVLSGGPFAQGTSNPFTLNGANAGPYSLFVETQGSFNNNIASYSVVIGGVTLFTGTVFGGQTTTVSNIVCPSPPPADPSSITASTNTLCSNALAPVTLTANGASGTVYWFTGSCATTGQIGTGNSIVVNPTSTTTYFARNFNGSLFSTGCVSTTVTVTNTPPINITGNTTICTGESTTLTVNGGGADATLANVLAAINANSAALIASIPTPSGFNMDAGVNSNLISDGCSDMYDGGNYINTNLQTQIFYSDNAVISSAAFGSGGQYFTRYLGPGGCQTGPATIFYMAADVNNITSLSITGNNGADGSGIQELSTFTVTANGVTYNCFLKRVYNAFDPSINQIFMIPEPNSVTQSMGGSTDDGLHALANLTGVTRVYYMLYAGANGSLINDAQATAIAQTFANIIPSNVSPYTWTWSPGGETTEAITVSPGSNTTYTVNATNGTCSMSTSLAVTVNPGLAAPTVDASANPICAGASTNLVGTGVTDISWFDAPTGGNLLGTSASGANFNVTPPSTTTYYAQATSSSLDSIVFNESFTSFAIPNSQALNWCSFRGNLLNSYDYTSATIRGSASPTGITISDPATVLALANALRTGSNYSIVIDGNTWNVTTGCVAGSSPCIGSPGIVLHLNTSSCYCDGPGAAWVIRPEINNENWGGLGTGTCSNQSQTMEVVFRYNTVGGGACASTRTPYTVNVDPLPTAIAGAALTPVCQGGTTAAMGGSVGGSATGGTWSGGAGSWTNANDPANATYTASGSESGSITLTLTTSGGSCGTTSVTKLILVNANALPPNVIASANPICVGGSTNLNATGSGTMAYYDAPTGGTLLGTTASGVDFPVSPGTTTTYYVEAQPAAPPGSQTFNFTGGVQTFVVPAGVTSIDVTMSGAAGGFGFPAISRGGYGGTVTGSVAVTPGETLEIRVGGVGTNGNTSSPAPGGFNGGGNGALYPGAYSGGGGGGASDIRVSPYAAANRIAVAGGGGGGAYNYGTPEYDRGGGGGGLTGATGFGGNVEGGQGSGTGGSQAAGGIGGTYGGWCTGFNGGLETGGNGGSCTNSGGGGGGGYYGGGGGTWSGGGGGSSFLPGGTHTQDVNNGAGIVTISWAGSTSCPSLRTPITVTVDAPSVAPTSITNLDPSICNGASTQLEIVGGSLSAGAQWEWSDASCGGAVIGNGSSINVTPNGNTTYFVRATAGNSCAASACTSIAVTMPTASTNLAINGDVATCVVNSGNWIHFYDINGRLIASVNSNGQDLGNVSATSLVAPSPYIMTSCTQPWDPSWFNAALARSFIITPTTQPTNPVSVRLYIADTEFNDYQLAALGTGANLNDDVLTITDMDMTKHSGPSEDGNPLNNCGVGSTIYVPQSGSGLTSALFGGFSGSYYIEYSISSFSEMFPMNSASSPLPVTMTSFNANCAVDKVNITWTTASEYNASHYSVQTSRDGQTWTEVAQIEAAGTTSQTTNYFYQDMMIGGVSYYRLVQVDFDGESEVFGPISVDCEINASSMTVYPNPTDNDFTVLIQTNETFENATIELVDLSGRSIEVKEMNITPGSTMVKFETDKINPGTYIVRIKGENNKFTPIRVVVL